MIGRLLLALAAMLTIGALDAPGAKADDSSLGCVAPPGLLAVGPPERRSARQIASGDPLTIVAVGSSSTQGIGATAAALNYPSRLEVELHALFPASQIRVINRGKAGEDAAEELARLDRDVIAEHPELVIWQVGTNAVLRRDDLATDRELIERGVDALKSGGSDVMLMDLQYAPRVLARPNYAEMEQVIGQVAKAERIGWFRRFELMHYWQEAAVGEDSRMIGGDGLHMSDRGYGCLAARLAEALAANWAGQLYAVPGVPRIAGLPHPRDGGQR